jgi:hypothetical protein
MTRNASNWFEYLTIAALLRVRVKLMSYHLRSRGVRCTINAQFRPPALAHRWSTAHGIITGRIEMGALRALDSGCDDDGNLWLQPHWGQSLPDHARSDACLEIVENAILVRPGEDRLCRGGLCA